MACVCGKRQPVSSLTQIFAGYRCRQAAQVQVYSTSAPWPKGKADKQCDARSNGQRATDNAVQRCEIERDKFGHPRLPNRGYYEEDKCNARRRWVHSFTGMPVDSKDFLGDWWTRGGVRDPASKSPQHVNTTVLKGNIENPIGMMTVPTSATGPLLVRGSQVNGMVVVPYAATKPGVSASATRGSRAINMSGGAISQVTAFCMRRIPVFIFSNLCEAHIFSKWMESPDRLEEIRKEILEVSVHGHLRELRVVPVGNSVHVNFFYTTGDAAGQNMVTAMSHRACQ